MKKFVVGLAAALVVVGSAAPAAAGVVIHEVRERGASKLAHIANQSHVFGIGAYRAELDAKNSGEFEGNEGHTAEELKQIKSGLITEEEAASGCGGASAATGPAGLLPLLVAAGALARRRR